VETAVKGMKNKKATGDDDVAGDVLKLLEENGLKIMTQQIKNIHEVGKWSNDFTEVTVIALKKKPAATKCSDLHTIGSIAQTAKVVAKILKRSERKIEDILGEDQFGFRRVKGIRAQGCNWDISEQTL
jgi:hypothetical protein